MRSDESKKGLERTPSRGAALRHRSSTRSAIAKPFIGIADSTTDLVPGHVHMATLVRAVEKGICAVAGDREKVCPGCDVVHVEGVGNPVGVVAHPI